MGKNYEKFCSEIVGQLSVANQNTISVESFLEKICIFFEIGDAFIYELNNKGIFERKVYFEQEFEQTRTSMLREKINLREILGLELLSELSEKKAILVSGSEGVEKQAEKLSKLEKKLLAVFEARTLIVMPVLNQHRELVAFIGMADRRGKVRSKEIEIEKSCAILSLLANKINLGIYKTSITNAENVLGKVLDHIGIDIYVNDYYSHEVLYVNQSMAAPYGGVDNMIGKKCWGSIFDDKDGQCEFCPQPRLLDENNEPTKTYSWDYQRAFDGSWFRVLSSAFPWTDGRMAHLVASIDITESKNSELMVEKAASTDYLTGLSNRRMLLEDLEKLTQRDKSFYILFCDLDGFKKINDTLGHEAGDVMLKSISSDLMILAEDGYRCYRHGGDEFVVVLDTPSDKSKLIDVIQAMMNLFTTPGKYQGQEIQCGCSIGVSCYPEDARTTKDLLHYADEAMYEAKNRGKGKAKFYNKGNFVRVDEYVAQYK